VRPHHMRCSSRPTRDSLAWCLLANELLLSGAVVTCHRRGSGVHRYLRGGSRSSRKKQSAEAARAVPPTRLWSAAGGAAGPRRRVVMSAEAAAVRPHACLCVLRLEAVDLDDLGGDITPEEEQSLGERGLRQFIEAQTSIHDGVGQRRAACAIGTHDLDTIDWGSNAVAVAGAPSSEPNAAGASESRLNTLLIDARPPASVAMVPLKAESDCAMTVEAVIGAAVASTSRGGPVAAARRYAAPLASLPRVALLLDASGVVLSLPPLTNAKHSAVHACSRSILVEVTSATSLGVCRQAALDLIAELIDIVEKSPRELNGSTDAGSAPEPESAGEQGSAPAEVVAAAASAAARVDRAMTLAGATMPRRMRVTVEPLDVVCGWSLHSVRSRFPSIDELRAFDEGGG
jgi:hypothetical protein